MPSILKAACAAAIVVALCALPARAELEQGPIASRPEIKSVKAFWYERGEEAGRGYVEVKVRFGDVTGSRAGLLSDEAELYGRVAVRIRPPSGPPIIATTGAGLPKSVPGTGQTITLRAPLARREVLRLRTASKGANGAPAPFEAEVLAVERLDEWGDGEDDFAASAREARTVSLLPQAGAPVADQRCVNFAQYTPNRYGQFTRVEIQVEVNHATPHTFTLCSGRDLDVKRYSRSISAHHDVKIRTVPTPDYPVRLLELTYTPAAGFVGHDEFVITEQDQYGTDNGTHFVFRIDVKPFVMFAIGDSVTAGFGYFNDGVNMTPPDLFQTLPGEQRFDPIVLLDCKPLDVPNNRCSSNSTNRYGYSGTFPNYDADYGYHNQVSWAAQLAKMAGIVPKVTTTTSPQKTYRTYTNLAVTGSEPAHWAGLAPWSYDASTLGPMNQTVRAKPDLTVMTLGANPLLSLLLTDVDNIRRCTNEFKNDDESKLRICIKGLIAEVKLRERMRIVFAQLMQAPDNHVLLMLYPTVWPAISLYSPRELDVMKELVESELLLAVADSRADAERYGWGDRIRVVEPPKFHYGAPQLRDGIFLCDGGSKQARVTQDLFGFDPFPEPNPLMPDPRRPRFCKSQDYWVISGDTGIHPSKAGYAQMAKAAFEELSKLDLPIPINN